MEIPRHLLMRYATSVEELRRKLKTSNYDLTAKDNAVWMTIDSTLTNVVISREF